MLTGREDRQLLYVAATRGRAGNRLYLQTAEPGDEHTPPGQDTLRSPTPAETLGRILARDGTQTSATSAGRALHDPAALLAAAAARYLDSLAVAQRPSRHAFADVDPARELRPVFEPVLGRGGPLPWLQPVPAGLAADPVWGRHLHEQAEQVRVLARQVNDRAVSWTAGTAPAWAAPLFAAGPTDLDLVGRLAVWRAAQQVPDDDRRPAGAPVERAAERRVQDDLLVRAAPRPNIPVGAGWRRQLDALAPRLRQDSDWPRLAQRLDAAAAAGHDVGPLVQRAIAQAPLPDELPAAALLWRLAPHLPSEHLAPSPDVQEPATSKGPTSAVPADAAVPARVKWQPLADAIDPRITACPNWPMLASALDRAQRAGDDVARRLPELAAQAPLDEQRPARALAGQLVQDCPAAGLQLTAAAWAADDRQRLQALRSTGTTARPTSPTPPASTRTPRR